MYLHVGKTVIFSAFSPFRITTGRIYFCRISSADREITLFPSPPFSSILCPFSRIIRD